MVRPLKDLTPVEKKKIAIEALVGDIVGLPGGDIASSYKISQKAVTTLKNQAIAAITETFSEERQKSSPEAPPAIRRADISARIDKLLGESASRGNGRREVVATETFDDEETDEDIDEIIPVDQIVQAIMDYNNDAGNKKKIYISRTIVADVSSHPAKDIDEYFREHKAEIDTHNTKHDLKRSTNRQLAGEDWQSWLDL
jgi:hypothetical protein